MTPLNLDFIILPFLFITLYFESFLLVTFLSSPARKGRERGPLVGDDTPKVAIIVPCFNEETTVGGTVESLLALDYPKDKLQLVLVDDGSTDGTAKVMDAYEDNPQITIIHQKNGGKHTAINAGIAVATDAVYVGCLDADSFVDPDALRQSIAAFHDPEVAAVTAAMSVHQPKTILESMQNAEYILGITLRHILSSVNGLYVTPGPFSIYRRQLVVDLGGFKKGHQAEDLEMALRIQRAGKIIENAPKARVYTKTPLTVPKLVKQRTRWTTGFLRNALYDYNDLIGNPKYGALGLLVLPLGLLAIASGIIMFFVIIFETVNQVIRTVVVASGVPLSYVLVPHNFHFIQWFYLPVTFVVLLGLVISSVTFTLMFVGKSISKTPGSLFLGVIAFLFLYGLIAPLWLMRAVTDVATGTRRAWR
ncbi:MAG: glycosyltransferase family 2 protein [Candidatus Pacebacteria bacterium]|nr:glycosyltransferase family 2 protein [Candidatus Paceibacterota bacterium]